MEKLKQAYEELLMEYIATLISKSIYGVSDVSSIKKKWLDKIKDLEK
jgi:hypothetical protein